MKSKLNYDQRLAGYVEDLVQLYAGGVSRDEGPAIRLAMAKKLKAIILKEAGQALGHRGGRKTSPAKVETAQTNGREGGRPRKVTGGQPAAG